MDITKDFDGGNINVLKIEENRVLLENELRDTTEEWFYWAFCVKGAQGKTITFRFNRNARVGYYGAAVSHDLKNWIWSDTKIDDTSFSYTFGEDEDKVYFAHNMVYSYDMFLDFAKRNEICIKTLCKSQKGRDIPYFTFGNGNKKVVLTARHHACESTGNYVLQGFVEALLKNLPKDYLFLCVPFVDFDGVVDGDQGKSRAPHDHNRDYDLTKPAIYNSVAEIRKFCENNNVVFGFDFHSPWHTGGRNDRNFIPKKSIIKLKKINKFAELLEKNNTEDAMAYHCKYDVEPNTFWNKVGTPCFASIVCDNPYSEFAFTLETAYFGVEDAKFSQQRAVNLGNNTARTFVEYISTVGCSRE